MLNPDAAVSVLQTDTCGILKTPACMFAFISDDQIAVAVTVAVHCAWKDRPWLGAPNF